MFSSISSVLTTPKPKADLALGDLFGTSIFVTTVVLAIIIFTKSFRVAVSSYHFSLYHLIFLQIIPTLRDLIFYMITLAFIVFCFLKYDKIEIWMPATFLGIYGVYVITVIVLGILRSRRKKRNSEKKARADLEDESRPASAASGAPIYGSGALKIKEERISMSALFSFVIGYSQFIRNLNRANRKKAKEADNNNEGGYVNGGFEDPEAQKGPQRNISIFYKQKTFESDLDSIPISEETDSGDEGREEEFGFAHGQVLTSHDQLSIAPTEMEVLTTWRSWAWVWDLLNHLKSWPSREEFKEMNIFVKIVAVIKVIPVFFFKMTVPSNEMSWCKPLFILHCFASIQFALFSIQSES